MSMERKGKKEIESSEKERREVGSLLLMGYRNILKGIGDLASCAP